MKRCYRECFYAVCRFLQPNTNYWHDGAVTLLSFVVGMYGLALVQLFQSFSGISIIVENKIAIEAGSAFLIICFINSFVFLKKESDDDINNHIVSGKTKALTALFFIAPFALYFVSLFVAIAYGR